MNHTRRSIMFASMLLGAPALAPGQSGPLSAWAGTIDQKLLPEAGRVRTTIRVSGSGGPLIGQVSWKPKFVEFRTLVSSNGPFSVIITPEGQIQMQFPYGVSFLSGEFEYDI